MISGEGGALLISDPRWIERAEILREKGTNRKHFALGKVDKYTWVDVGSSYLPSEITAAFLWAQFEEADRITRERLAIWSLYHGALADLERRGMVRRPIVPANCTHNAHMYYVLTANLRERQRVLEYLNGHGVNAVFHYVPLHSSPAGRKFGRTHGELPTTDNLSERLVRLPLWLGMGEQHIARVVNTLGDALGGR